MLAYRPPQVINFFPIEDGRIADIWSEWDTLNSVTVTQLYQS